LTLSAWRTAITGMPAAFADTIPDVESSKTTAFFDSMPNFSSAFK